MSIAYRLTRLAEQDLLEIRNYITRDNRSAADRLMDRFDEQFILLTEQPLIGPSCEHLILTCDKSLSATT